MRFGPDGTTLAPELPGGIASLAGLAAAAVELFERVHLVTDAAFWRRLTSERARRAEEIEAIRVGCSYTSTATDRRHPPFHLSLGPASSATPDTASPGPFAPLIAFSAPLLRPCPARERSRASA